MIFKSIDKMMRFEFIAYRYGNHIVASAVKRNYPFILSTQTNTGDSVPWEIYDKPSYT